MKNNPNVSAEAESILTGKVLYGQMPGIEFPHCSQNNGIIIPPDPIFIQKMHDGDIDDCLNPRQFCEMLNSFDYFRFQGNVVSVKDFIINPVSSLEIKHFVGEYSKNCRQENKNQLFKKLDTFCNPKQLEHLPQFEGEFLKDDARNAYLPFRNCVVQIDKNGWRTRDYNELKKYVMQESVIDHEFQIRDSGELSGSDWYRFLGLTCTDPATELCEEDRLTALMATLGYNMHQYKSRSQAALTIISDALAAGEEGSRNGGRGKGILCQAIKHILPNTNWKDGKQMNKHYDFTWSDVKHGTPVIIIDDLNARKFPLETLYSAVSDGFSINPKGRMPFTLDYENSPKIIITTNDGAFAGTDGSDLRRRMDMQLLPYFSAHRKPINVFNKEFFHDWNASQWNDFYNVCAWCIYLSIALNVAQDGLPKYNCTAIETALRQELSSNFLEFMDAFYGDRIADRQPFQVVKKEAREEFNGLIYPMEQQSPQAFNKKLIKYATLIRYRIEHIKINRIKTIDLVRFIPDEVYSSK